MGRYRVTGTIFGHPAYSNGKEPRWADNDELVPKAPDGSSMPDENHPCPKCNKMPGPSGHDPCIDQLEGVSFACCGHGDDSDSYVAFDQEDAAATGRPKVLRGEEAQEYFRLVK